MISGTWSRRAVLGLLALGPLTLAGCSPSFDALGPRPPPADIVGSAGNALPQPGESFGTGPVQVALLLPLTGDPNLASLGISLANGSRLAMDFIEQSQTIGDNITIQLIDTGADSAGAARAATRAVEAGAQLMLGPLRAEQVQAAGAVAHSAGIPVIAFSNNPSVAAPGVYLLGVLPQAELRRSLGFSRAAGHRHFAGLFPQTESGRLQQAAFQGVAAELGLAPRLVQGFASPAEARSAVARLAPMILAGEVDALVLPDRASAPLIANLLQQLGVRRGSLQIIGSADWSGDTAIQATPLLYGAIFPAVDEAGYRAIQPQYEAKFAGRPHPLTTLSYTATILANVSALSRSEPPYQRSQITLPGGFNGRDGVFRFRSDGTSDYALAIRSVTESGSSQLEGPKL